MAVVVVNSCQTVAIGSRVDRNGFQQKLTEFRTADDASHEILWW